MYRQINGFQVAEENVLSVRLMCGCRIDHKVCIDLPKGIILDSAEKYSLNVEAKSLGICATGEAR